MICSSNHLYRNTHTHTHRFSKGGPERIPIDGTLIRNSVFSTVIFWVVEALVFFSKFVSKLDL